MFNTPFFVGLGFAVFSAWLLRHAIVSYRESTRSLRWPSVPCELESIELWGKRNINGVMTEVNNLSVAYHYEVDGKRLSGSRVTYYTLVYPETVTLHDKLKDSDPLMVYYDPADPSESSLVPGPRQDNKRYSDIILGVIGLVASLAICISGFLGVLK